MKIELFKGKSLHDLAMERFDLLYSKLEKISAPSYQDAFIALVYGETRVVSSGWLVIDHPRDFDSCMSADFFVKGYVFTFKVAFRRPILIAYRFENLLTVAYFLTLFEAAGKAYDKIVSENPRDFAGHCKAVARQVDTFVRRIENELSKY